LGFEETTHGGDISFQTKFEKSYKPTIFSEKLHLNRDLQIGKNLNYFFKIKLYPTGATKKPL